MPPLVHQILLVQNSRGLLLLLLYAFKMIVWLLVLPVVWSGYFMRTSGERNPWVPARWACCPLLVNRNNNNKGKGSADFTYITPRYCNSLFHSLISLGRMQCNFCCCSYSHSTNFRFLVHIHAGWTEAVWIQSLPKAFTQPLGHVHPTNAMTQWVVFYAIILQYKAILGRREAGLMRCFGMHIPHVQERSLVLLASNPAYYYCATVAPYNMQQRFFSIQVCPQINADT